MFFRFLPKDFDFFSLFEKQAEYAVKAASYLKEVVSKGVLDEERLKKMHDIEREGDEDEPHIHLPAVVRPPPDTAICAPLLHGCTRHRPVDRLRAPGAEGKRSARLREAESAGYAKASKRHGTPEN
jgi:hypothetical protein